MIRSHDTSGKIIAENILGGLHRHFCALQAKKLGDGLMALFGYPNAHENDAERAARAALSIPR